MPEEIVNLLSDVRSFLQDKCEPPVYVSDRRLLKTVALMQARCLCLSVVRAGGRVASHWCCVQ